MALDPSLSGILDELNKNNKDNKTTWQEQNATLNQIRTILTDSNRQTFETQKESLNRSQDVIFQLENISNVGSSFADKINAKGIGNFMNKMQDIPVMGSIFKTFNGTMKGLSGVLKILPGAFTSILSTVNMVQLQLSVIDLSLKMLESIISTLPKIIEETITTLIDTIVSIVSSFFTVLARMGAFIIQLPLLLGKVLIGILTSVVTGVLNAFGELFNILIETLMAIPLAILSMAGSLLNSVVEALYNIADGIVDRVVDFLQQIFQIIGSIFTNMLKLGVMIPTMIIKFFGQAISMFFEIFSEIVGTFVRMIIDSVLMLPFILVKGITKVLTSLFNISDIIESIGSEIFNAITKLIMSLPILAGLFLLIFGGFGAEMLTMLNDVMTGFFNWFIPWLQINLPAFVDSLLKSISPILMKIIDLGETIFKGLYGVMKVLMITLVNRVIPWMREQVTTWMDWLQKKWDKHGEDIMAEIDIWLENATKIFKDVWDAFTKFIEPKLEEFIGWVGINVVTPIMDKIFDQIVTLLDRIWEHTKVKQSEGWWDLISYVIDKFSLLGWGYEAVTGERLTGSGDNITKNVGTIGLDATNEPLTNHDLKNIFGFNKEEINGLMRQFGNFHGDKNSSEFVKYQKQLVYEMKAMRHKKSPPLNLTASVPGVNFDKVTIKTG